MYVSMLHVFMIGMEQNDLVEIKCVCVQYLSLELQQTECALMHDVNDLYVTADRGHTLIAHSLISSYHKLTCHQV